MGTAKCQSCDNRGDSKVDVDDALWEGGEYTCANCLERSESKHTSTPWMAKGAIVWANPIGSELVCNCEKLSDPKTEEANAAFIVKAVNSHDELLEALEILLHQVRAEIGIFADSWGEPHAQSAIGIANAAIAKAKGEL